MTDPTQPDADDPIVKFMLSLGFFMRYNPGETWRVKGKARYKDAEHLFFPIAPNTDGEALLNCLVLVGTRDKHAQRFLPCFWSNKILRHLPALLATEYTLPYPRHRTLNMLHILAATMTELGYPVTSLPETLAIWDGCANQMPEFDAADRRTQYRVFAHAAAIANLPDVSLDDKLEYAMRDIPLDAITEFRVTNTPFSMIADLYPVVTGKHLTQFTTPGVEVPA